MRYDYDPLIKKDADRIKEALRHSNSFLEVTRASGFPNRKDTRYAELKAENTSTTIIFSVERIKGKTITRDIIYVRGLNLLCIDPRETTETALSIAAPLEAFGKYLNLDTFIDYRNQTDISRSSPLVIRGNYDDKTLGTVLDYLSIADRMLSLRQDIRSGFSRISKIGSG